MNILTIRVNPDSIFANYSEKSSGWWNVYWWFSGCLSSCT